MINKPSYKVLITTLLFMGSFFLYISWYLFPLSIVYEFPYYDRSNELISANPLLKISYPLQTILPYFVDRFVYILYLICFIFTPKMKMPYLGNIWIYHLCFHLYLNIDYLLFFRSLPVFTYVIISMVLIHLSYLIHELSNTKE